MHLQSRVIVISGDDEWRGTTLRCVYDLAVLPDPIHPVQVPVSPWEQAHHRMILETVCDSTLLCIFRRDKSTRQLSLYSASTIARATNTHHWYSCQINTHRSWLAYTTGWIDVGQTNTAPDRINRSPSLFAQLKCNLLALELLHKGADGLTDRLDTTNSSFSLWDLQFDFNQFRSSNKRVIYI